MFEFNVPALPNSVIATREPMHGLEPFQVTKQTRYDTLNKRVDISSLPAGNRVGRPNGLKVRGNADAPQLLIYDTIGPARAGLIDAKSVIETLNSFGNVKEINVRINSEGGDVFEGIGIYNALARHPARIVVDVDAIAASAAAFIAMAGNRIRIASNAMMMVHNCWCLTIGNADELVKTADLLRKIDAQQVDAFVSRTKLSKQAVMKLVDAETWLTASEAKAKGFADEIGPAMNVSAHVSDSVAKSFKHVPEHFHQRPAATTGESRIAAAARKNDEIRRRLGMWKS